MSAEDGKSLEALFPDVDAEVRDPDTGEPVRLSVREFRMLEGLRAQTTAQDLVAALAALARRADDVAGVEAEAFDAAIGEHADAWVALVAMAADRDPGWIARLPDADARTLNAAMWEANGPFFVRRILGSLRAREATRGMLASLASYRTSSRPATDATNGRSPDGSPGARPRSPGGTPASAAPTSRPS